MSLLPPHIFDAVTLHSAAHMVGRLSARDAMLVPSMRDLPAKRIVTAGWSPSPPLRQLIHFPSQALLHFFVTSSICINFVCLAMVTFVTVRHGIGSGIDPHHPSPHPLTTITTTTCVSKCTHTNAHTRKHAHMHALIALQQRAFSYRQGGRG